jgi:carotenoid cleavage dioxygenase
VHEEQLDDVSHAFPRIDDRLTGLRNRFGWAVAPRDPNESGMEAATVLVKYDLHSGARTVHDFGPTSLTGEPVFVPAHDGAAEDEGHLVTFVLDTATATSSFVVLDAADMTAAPVAVVALPQRVPQGFHGSWFADE